MMCRGGGRGGGGCGRGGGVRPDDSPSRHPVDPRDRTPQLARAGPPTPTTGSLGSRGRSPPFGTTPASRMEMPPHAVFSRPPPAPHLARTAPPPRGQKNAAQHLAPGANRSPPIRQLLPSPRWHLQAPTVPPPPPPPTSGDSTLRASPKSRDFPPFSPTIALAKPDSRPALATSSPSPPAPPTIAIAPKSRKPAVEAGFRCMGDIDRRARFSQLRRSVRSRPPSHFCDDSSLPFPQAVSCNGAVSRRGRECPDSIGASPWTAPRRPSG